MTSKKYSDSSFHETSLLAVWGGALTLIAVLVAVDASRGQFASLPRLGLSPSRWIAFASGLLTNTPLLVVAVVLLTAAAGVVHHLVLRARRRAMSSRIRGSVTTWWDSVRAPRR